MWMVPVTSDLDGYRRFWLPVAAGAFVTMVVVILELGLIAYLLWRR